MDFQKAVVETILPLESGTSERGSWRAQDVIVRDAMPVPYPDTVVIRFFNEGCDQVAQVREGDMVNVVWSAKKRLYTDRNGKTRYSQDNTGASISKI